jgi:hypothetical protein
MEINAEAVQTSRKKRPQEAKVGRIKYTLQLIKMIQSDIEEVKLMQRTIFAGLKGLFHFEKPMIQKIACVDEVDVEILEQLFESGSAGLLPKDLAVRLSQFRIGRHQVSRRILRMNKRLVKEFGEQVAEKRGWHWALTSFGFDVWVETEEEMREVKTE